jgi:site-specific DNA-methyltransferase (adenine-specific)/modification methylase
MNLRIRDGVYIPRSDWNEKHNKISNKYNNYKDDLTLEEYYKQQKEIIEECLRISDVLFYNIQMVTGNKPALFQLLGTFYNKIKEVIIWDKVNAQPAMSCGVLNSQFEFIFVFQNSKPYNRMFDICNFKRGCETNLWNIKREKNDLHKATFPTSLIERILENFSNKNDLILDCFSGSGTTAVACHNLNRRFICIEKDYDYWKASCERLENAQAQLKLF